MLLHFHTIKVVKKELGDLLDDDSVVPIEERLRGIKRQLLVDQLSREQIVTNEDVLHEDFLKLLFVSVHDPELLECFEAACTGAYAYI